MRQQIPLSVGMIIPEWVEMMVNDIGGTNRAFPLLIHFWSISCPACKFNMPQLHELRNRYETRGLRTVAIHMPRAETELDRERVHRIASEIGITETLVSDDEHSIVDAFGVSAVPAYFLFDAEGKLRRHALGNFGVRMIGQAVQRLLGDTPDETKE